jgi:hypothetical protein
MPTTKRGPSSSALKTTAAPSSAWSNSPGTPGWSPPDVIGAGQFEQYAADRSTPISVTPTVARPKEWAAPVQFWGVNVWGEAHAWVARS